MRTAHLAVLFATLAVVAASAAAASAPSTPAPATPTPSSPRPTPAPRGKSPETFVPNVLFVTLEASGHLRPLIAIAMEVQRRGFANVAIATTENRESFVRQHNVPFVNLGKQPSGLKDVAKLFFDNSVAPPDAMAAVSKYFGIQNRAIFEVLHAQWKSLPRRRRPSLEEGGSAAGADGRGSAEQDTSATAGSAPLDKFLPDFLVCDSLTTSCADLAELFDLPYATVSANPLGIACITTTSCQGRAGFFDIPFEHLALARSILDMGVLERALAPLFKLLVLLPFHLPVLVGHRNELRRDFKLPPVASWGSPTRNSYVPSGQPLSIMSNSWALDNAVPLAPYNAIVGPIVLQSATTDSFVQRSSDAALKMWLDARKPKSVVYVSFTTMAELRPAEARKVLRVLNAFLDASLSSSFKGSSSSSSGSGGEGEGEEEVSVLWSLANSKALLSSLSEEEKRFLAPADDDAALEDDEVAASSQQQQQNNNTKGSQSSANNTKRRHGRSIVVRGFVPQVAVLNHPALGAFWSHGGSNSLIEALFAGVPLLLMPMGADQQVNRQHAVDRGVGLSAPGLESLEELETKEETAAKLLRLLREPSFRARATKLGRMMRHEDGVRRAVDLLHLVIEEGSEHLVPQVYRLDSLFQCFCLDVVLVWIVIALVFVKLLFPCCRRMCCSCCCCRRCAGRRSSKEQQEAEAGKAPATHTTVKDKNA